MVSFTWNRPTTRMREGESIEQSQSRAKKIWETKKQQQKIAVKESKLRSKQLARRVKGFRQGVKEFGGAANPVPVRISQAQEDLKELFGGGEKIWGNIQEPVSINNDLNPRRRGDYETGAMFGF